jgi:hypothetical protein
LVEPPTDVWQVVDVYPHDGKRGEWAVDFPLWTEKEGRSDLTLAISVRESDGRGAVAVGDLHVL